MARIRKRHANDLSALGVDLPKLPRGGVYHLVSIGALRRQANDPARYEVQLYFQAKRTTEASSKLIGSTLRLYVDMRYASAFQTGTVWHTRGHGSKAFITTYSDRRIFAVGSVSPKLVLANEALATNELADVIPSHVRSSMWLAIWNQGAQQLIVPCFELLRCLYYCGGPRITAFFLARFPVEWLGRIVASPAVSNGYGVHLCTTTQFLTANEAHVITALLTDPMYYKIVNQAHLGLAVQWMHGHRKALFHADFYLGRDVSFDAHGVAFTRAGLPAFWAGTLQPMQDCFQFKHVLYHPLSSSGVRSAQLRPLVSCFTDVLADVEPEERTGPKTTPYSRPQLIEAEKFAAPVTKGFSWAVASASKRLPAYYLDADITLPWEHPHDSQLSLWPIPLAFQHLEQHFTRQKRHLCRLGINNPGWRYGDGWSICYYGGHLPLSGKIYCQQILRFVITEISHGSGWFYLVYSGQRGTCLLVYHPDLQRLTSETLQLLLGKLASEVRQWSGNREMTYHLRLKRNMGPLALHKISLTHNMDHIYALCERLLPKH